MKHMRPHGVLVFWRRPKAAPPPLRKGKEKKKAKGWARENVDRVRGISTFNVAGVLKSGAVSASRVAARQVLVVMRPVLGWLSLLT